MHILCCIIYAVHNTRHEYRGKLRAHLFKADFSFLIVSIHNKVTRAKIMNI